MTTESDKSVSRSVSLPHATWGAIERLTEKLGTDRSKWFAEIVDRELASAGMLPEPATDLAHDAFERLVEAEGAEKAREIIEGILAAALAKNAN